VPYAPELRRAESVENEKAQHSAVARASVESAVLVPSLWSIGVLSILCTIVPTTSFEACPEPVTFFLISFGLYEWSGNPDFDAAIRAAGGCSLGVCR
jgi:hypothetical protein